jgi:hypothetical protein
MLACLVLPVAWLSIGWSRDGAPVTLESVGTAVYFLFAAIWLPLAWLRWRQRAWLWFSSHILLFTAGVCVLAGHLLGPSGPRPQLALLALASAASAFTLVVLELIGLMKRRLAEGSRVRT